MRSGLRSGPLCDCTQYIAEGIYEFEGSRWRKRYTCRHMNNRLLALLRRIVDSFRNKAGCSYGDDDRASVIGDVDQLISINLQDMRSSSILLGFGCMSVMTNPLLQMPENHGPYHNVY